MGHSGNRGGCCTLGSRDWIIGPLDDVDAFIARLERQLGRLVARDEVVIELEEGKRLFPERSMWQNPAHYPAMRTQSEAPHACRFYDEAVGCTVHAIRPKLCESYECDWLRASVGAFF